MSTVQGPDTDRTKVAEIRAAITAGRAHSVTLTNYRKDGRPFVSFLSVTPIHAPCGRVTHYVGIQSDISELTRNREDKLAALTAAAEVSPPPPPSANPHLSLTV